MARTFRQRGRQLALGGCALLLLAGCTSGPEDPGRSADDSSAADSTPSAGASEPAESPSATASQSSPASSPSPSSSPSAAPPHSISVEALAQARHQGDQLRLDAVRERTATFISYDVTYCSRTTDSRGTRSLRISGVLNVPRGKEPFPAVVLAHGYIDPAFYVRGQGMTRERGYLADRGFVALHVDYRNHAESGDDPRVSTAVRLGYSSDVINAAKALVNSPDVPVDPDRLAYVGRSMGGGVVQKALIAEPGLVRAGVAWASVSSLEAENHQHFNAPDPADRADNQELARRHGLPEQNPRFWRGISARPYLDRITEPVLLVHGRFDDTCPPRWAIETQRAMRRAGVESRLRWYDDGHAFGPEFFAAMEDTVRFLRGSFRSGG